MTWINYDNDYEPFTVDMIDNDCILVTNGILDIIIKVPSNSVIKQYINYYIKSGETSLKYSFTNSYTFSFY